jgi:hypothetical protein
MLREPQRDFGRRPSNSPAQGLVSVQRGELLFETLRERISSATGIDLWDRLICWVRRSEILIPLA